MVVFVVTLTLLSSSSSSFRSPVSPSSKMGLHRAPIQESSWEGGNDIMWLGVVVLVIAVVVVGGGGGMKKALEMGENNTSFW